MGDIRKDGSRIFRANWAGGHGRALSDMRSHSSTGTTSVQQKMQRKRDIAASETAKYVEGIYWNTYKPGEYG